MQLSALHRSEAALASLYRFQCRPLELQHINKIAGTEVICPLLDCDVSGRDAPRYAPFNGILTRGFTAFRYDLQFAFTDRNQPS